MKQGWIQLTDNGTEVPFAPKTKADIVYMDDTQESTVKEELLRRKPIQFLAEFPHDGWSASVPYTQTVEVEGLLETDVPLVDAVFSEDAATAIKEVEAYGFLDRIDTDDGYLKAYCYTKKPAVNVTVQLRVVR